jgi:hypothetical protein
MKIRTIEHLNDILSNELAWRKKELSVLRGDIISRKNQFSYKVLLRAGITILYAHWEGFIKKAGQHYLEFVYLQKPQNKELQHNFLTLSLLKNINFNMETKKASHFYQITDFFINSQRLKAKLPVKEGIDTGSNLSTNVLREIIWCLGLDYSMFESKEKLIDSRLVDKRNHIAHGENIGIDFELYDSLHSEILCLLDGFKNQIENAAILQLYLRK